MRHPLLAATLITTLHAALLPWPAWAGDNPDHGGDCDCETAAAPEQPAASAVASAMTLADPRAQLDFPAMALAADGTPWLALISHDGKADTLQLAKRDGGKLAVVADVSAPGIVHQPAVAIAKDGAVWCFWGQVDARDIVTLRARRFADGKSGDEITLAASAGADTFADAGTDAAGRVWVAWQSQRRGQGDIFARWLDPQNGRWSPEIQASKPVAPGEEGGNWEPRLAFDGKDGAWIAFDSSRGKAKEFNLYLAHVGLDGKSAETQLTHSPEYEARAGIAASADGKTLWVAAERGHRDWGMEQRNHEEPTGLNGQKRILLGKFDMATEKFSEIPLPGGGKFMPAKVAADSHGTTMEANLPAVAVGADGAPVLAWRSYMAGAKHWNVRMARFDPAAKAWTAARPVPGSSFCQDRRMALVQGKEGLLLALPADGRQKNESLRAEITLARLAADLGPAILKPPAEPAPSETKPHLTEPAADRPLADHHTWEVGGKKYRLVFGDLHRHTDFSNCIPGGDGCLTEHFRYACDTANLDFLGTSDHTDVVKVYTPYEWWQTQKACDVFFTPGKFTPLYTYEREQTWPWGHRNVAFAQRGGPVVYIKRKNWLASPWKDILALDAKSEEITPMELWDVLEKYGKPVAVISHTGASSMGTDWDKYQARGGINNKVENSVEIFQAARVSYEGQGAPQPTVGYRKGEKYNPSTGTKAPVPAVGKPIMDFGKTAKGEDRNHGTYQHALGNGYKLGVFASSDHIATHTAFGGVYVEETTREGIVEGLRLRRSIAATDKIFVEFSCDGHPMGEVFNCAGKPTLAFAVEGTAKIGRVTLVRNEKNYQVWEPGEVKFAATFADPEPLPGENRYYLRVEQADGNMAWSSPVWATVK